MYAIETCKIPTDRPIDRQTQPLIDVREMTDTLPDSIPIGSWKRQNWRSAEPKIKNSRKSVTWSAVPDAPMLVYFVIR